MAISVRIEMHDSTDLTALNALNEALDHASDNAADVINNSWTTKIKHESIDDAISNALSNGRNGKGCVVLFASGNDSTNVSKMPYRDNEDVICVGGTTIDGYRWLGSNYNEHIDIVAPGSYIPTLDENPENRNPDGTSYAAPHVSAIAGLMLSVNPLLTSTQVTEILARTATKLPAYSYSTAKSYGTWNDEVGYGLVNCYDAVNRAYYYDEDNYQKLIEFDYSGSEVEMNLITKDNIAVIWDWEAKDISFISASASSPKDTTISHTYSAAATRRIIIAETISPGDTASSSSSALTRFDLTTGKRASNIDIKSINTALKYVRIIGGSNFVSQSVSISGLSALEELYLVQLKNASISVSDCGLLKIVGTSRHIWRHRSPTLINPISTGTLDPNVVGGGTTSDEWPSVPESQISPSSLSISDCPRINTISLENCGFTSFSFSGLSNLSYVYLSSQSTKIVGAGTNLYNPSSYGYYLSNAILTLPMRSSLSGGKVVIRCVNTSNTAYVPVSIATSYKETIENSCRAKYWTVVWDSGIN